jgi:hypothetical protein
MDFQASVSSAGTFRRITLSLQEGSRPADCELSAIITPPSGRDEIFLPSPERILPTVTYPHSGGRFVTHTGPGKYQIIFQPKEPGPHSIKLVGRILDRRLQASEGKPFKKELQITF